MKLSAPKMLTFLVGILLGVVAIVLQLLNIGTASSVPLILAIAGLVVLALGNLVKGL